MLDKGHVVTGYALLAHCQDEQARGRVRAFLGARGDRGPTEGALKEAKNVFVLRGRLGSYLSVPKPLRQMPMIQRTGRYSSSMIIQALNEVSTDGDLQRMGSPYITLQGAVRHLTKHIRLMAAAWKNEDLPKLDELRKQLLGKLKQELNQSLPCNVAKEIAELIWKKLTEDLENEKREKLVTMLQQTWKEIAKEEKATGTNLERQMRVLEQLFKVQVHLWNHLKHATEAKHLVVQGCGDISMNFWNVGWLNREKETLIHVPLEPLDEREYSCLVAWKREQEIPLPNDAKGNDTELFHAGKGEFPQISIGTVRFRQYDTQKVRLLVRKGNRDEVSTEPIDHCADYVLYGQRLVWKGERVSARDIVLQCSDLRHVLKLPNLNPEFRNDEWVQLVHRIESNDSSPWKTSHLKDFLAIFPADDRQSLGEGLEPWRRRPRLLFGIPSKADVWLGEAVFLEQPALLQTACEHPVELPLWTLGAPLGWVTLCLLRERYKFVQEPESVRQENQFSWEVRDPTNIRLVWQPRLASYPCTLVGAGRLHSSVTDKGDGGGEGEGEKTWGDLFLLAWGHNYDPDQNLSIFDCAEVLKDLGAQAVLLIDEGQDVFQQYFRDHAHLQERFWNPEESFGKWDVADGKPFMRVPIRRDRIRASLSFWTTEAVPD